MTEILFAEILSQRHRIQEGTFSVFFLIQILSTQSAKKSTNKFRKKKMEVVPKELGFHEEDFPLASSSNLKPDHALLEFSLINNHPSSSQVFVIKSTCVKHLIAVSPACGFIKSSDQIKVFSLKDF